MNVIKVKSHEEMSAKAAVIIAAQILKKENPVIGLATGSTPILTYQKLVEMYQNGVLDFSNVTSFNLDEYLGLKPDNDQSYYYFMHEHLFNHVNMKPENVNIPSGEYEDIEAGCKEYEEQIRQAGGLDLQLLGIGPNGHIGFNEPNENLFEATHMEELTESTIEANKRFFSSIEEVPTKAVSMGMGTIMQAKSILLVAGDGKQGIVDQVINGPITTKVPASLLKLHQDVTLIYVG